MHTPSGRLVVDYAAVACLVTQGRISPTAHTVWAMSPGILGRLSLAGREGFVHSVSGLFDFDAYLLDHGEMLMGDAPCNSFCWDLSCIRACKLKCTNQ